MSDVWKKGDYTISTDPSRLDLDLIHDFLANHSYWASGRARDVVERSIENSLAFGIYRGTEQVGFARIVTDYATFAWVADVFVLPEHRGLGLSKWLMEIIVAHPQLQGFRRWVLSTKDAHELYERLALSNFIGLGVGWSASIQRCKSGRTTGYRTRSGSDGIIQSTSAYDPVATPTRRGSVTDRVRRAVVRL